MIDPILHKVETLANEAQWTLVRSGLSSRDNPIESRAIGQFGHM